MRSSMTVPCSNPADKLLVHCGTSTACLILPFFLFLGLPPVHAASDSLHPITGAGVNVPPAEKQAEERVPMPAAAASRPAGERTENGPAGLSSVETYYYEAVPVGKESDKEELELTLSFEEDSSEYASTIVSPKSDERISIKMSKEGQLISGTRSLLRSPGGPSEEKIWRDGETAYVEQTSGSDRKIKHLDIPEGKTLALEGSLIILLRFFPYDSATQWDLFMIDFSGRSVTATARQAGIERITVPAGEFSCYRMEVLVHTFILSPTIVCWVTTEKPHFVVRSEGKRGIFTPKYITTLIGRQ